jgi:hypothetical protein
MSEIQADLSQYYPMKAVFEQILGKASFMKVKDYGSLASWKAETVRLLKAIAYSIDTTVEVADEDWRVEVRTEIQHGISCVQSASEIDELFSSLSAALVKVVFLQIGFFPLGHSNLRFTPPLIPRNWKLNPVRSVQYVQSEQQRLTQKRIQEARSGPSENT